MGALPSRSSQGSGQLVLEGHPSRAREENLYHLPDVIHAVQRKDHTVHGLYNALNRSGS